MKKIYITPSIQVTNLMINANLLAGSNPANYSNDISSEKDYEIALGKESWADED